MVHDDLEHDPELKFEVSDILATFLMGYPISAFFSCSNRLESGPNVFLDPAGGVMVHDDLEHDPELKFEVKVKF